MRVDGFDLTGTTHLPITVFKYQKHYGFVYLFVFWFIKIYVFVFMRAAQSTPTALHTTAIS